MHQLMKEIGALFSPKSIDLTGRFADIAFFVPGGGEQAAARAAKIPGVSAAKCSGGYLNLVLSNELLQAALPALTEPCAPFEASEVELRALFGAHYAAARLSEYVCRHGGLLPELPKSSAGRRAVVFCLCAAEALPEGALHRAAGRLPHWAMEAVNLAGRPKDPEETKAGALAAARCALAFLENLPNGANNNG